MKNLEQLRAIKEEVKSMEFSFKSIHRIMYLIYQTQDYLNTATPIPNKEIALHQTQKVINTDVINLIKSSSDDEIKSAYKQLINNFDLVMKYISN